MDRRITTDAENQKLIHILETSRELFWKHGIKRVSIEEICQEASVSKMTFYKNFKNKNELVMEIINRIYDDAVKRYRDLMDQDIPFEQKVRESLLMKMEGIDRMSQEFFNDYYLHADPEMSAFVQEKVSENLGMIIGDYLEAQKKGEIRKDINPKFILYFMNQMMEMMKDEKLESFYKDPQEMIMELLNFFFYGIMPRNRGK
ncbi:TetR/AcrR family transcriptional regulator [Bacteroidota bacterium]